MTCFIWLHSSSCKMNICVVFIRILQNTLEERRNHSRLAMAYKIINGHVILDPIMMPKIDYQRLFRKCHETKVGYQNQLGAKILWKTNFEKTHMNNIKSSHHLSQLFLSTQLSSTKRRMKKQMDANRKAWPGPGLAQSEHHTRGGCEKMGVSQRTITRFVKSARDQSCGQFEVSFLLSWFDWFFGSFLWFFEQFLMTLFCLDSQEKA